MSKENDNPNLAFRYDYYRCMQHVSTDVQTHTSSFFSTCNMFRFYLI